MKMLYVYGDPDDGFCGLFNSLLVKLTKSEIRKIWYQAIQEKVVNICNNIYARAYEFKDVDPNFVQFVRENLTDLDNCKEQDFFIVEE